MLLRIENATVHFKKVAALKGISLGVPPGGIVTIIGANGAGKTTTLRAISGLARLSSGEIWFDGQRIDGLLNQLGLLFVHQQGARSARGLLLLHRIRIARPAFAQSVDTQVVRDAM